MNLILRGHVRNSFENKNLYGLISKLSKIQEIKIFIHTWNVIQTNLSWRHIPENKTNVSEELIKNYFEDLSVLIEKIIIDDDKKIEIKGRKEGNIGHSHAPVLGYKYMFYGMMRAAECVLNQVGPNALVAQTRFDVMSNWGSFRKEQIINFINAIPSKRIQFMMPEVADESTVGIDNIYIATAKDMYDLLSHMYHNLDEIDERLKKIRHMGHQEWLTMFEAMNLFN
jgi:hypothetical protein